MNRMVARRLARLILAVLVVGTACVVLADRWRRVNDSAAHVSVTVGLSALLPVLVGLLATMLSWRALLRDLGSDVPFRAAARVFFVSQLGKYVPGSVWPFVAQMELGRDHGVPRQRSLTVGLVTVLFSLTAGLVLAAATLPLLSRSAAERYWPALAPIPLLVAMLHPRVANRWLDWVLVRLRRPSLERPLSEPGVLRALGWSVVAWVAFGVHIWLLVRNLGAFGLHALPISIGAFALAWAVGFLVVVAPAGAGVREVALIAALAPVLPQGGALLVALVSRLLMTVGDLLAAGVALALCRRTRRSSHGSCAGDADGTPASESLVL